MNGILAFLLFAGALHVDLVMLKGQKWAIGLMASIGVIISIAVAGTGLWLACPHARLRRALPWALVFGALISPTDPVAVLGLLKTSMCRRRSRPRSPARRCSTTARRWSPSARCSALRSACQAIRPARCMSPVEHCRAFPVPGRRRHRLRPRHRLDRLPRDGGDRRPDGRDPDLDRRLRGDLCAVAAPQRFRPDRRGRHRPVDRQSRRRACDEREGAGVSVLVLGGDRRIAQFGPVPADRAGSAGARRRSGAGLDRARRRSRSCWRRG